MVLVLFCLYLQLLELASKDRDVDFKDMKALEVVEKFLKQCNRAAVTEFQE